MEKYFWVTLHRELNLVRYSEKSDLKDAVNLDEGGFRRLLDRKYGECWYKLNGDKFVESVKNNLFNNWINY